MSVVADKKTGQKKADEPDADVPLNTLIEGALKRQMGLYIEDHNAKDDHRATVRSTVEAALRAYLKSKGFWPPPKEEE